MCRTGRKKSCAIPQLAPEPDEKGRYCVAYRDWSGTARRLRLTREKGKSQQILNGLVPVYYDPVKGFNPPTSLRAIANGIRPSLPQHEASLPAIAKTFLENPRSRVRDDDQQKRPKGPVGIEEYGSLRHCVIHTLDWGARYFGDRFKLTPFAALFDETAYDAMMLEFSREYGIPRINKHRLMVDTMQVLRKAAWPPNQHQSLNRTLRRVSGSVAIYPVRTRIAQYDTRLMHQATGAFGGDRQILWRQKACSDAFGTAKVARTRPVSSPRRSSTFSPPRANAQTSAINVGPLRSYDRCIAWLFTGGTCRQTSRASAVLKHQHRSSRCHTFGKPPR